MEGEVIRDLSSPHSTNRVYLIRNQRHGDLIKKEFGSHSCFKRVVEAMKAIDRSLHPAIYKIDMRRRHIFMSYNPIKTKPESMDACAANLMKKLHETTKRYSGVRDPGTGRVFSTWKDYLKEKGTDAVETLKKVKDYGKAFEERLATLQDSPFSPVSFIHRDIRPEHIGERRGNYILLDFDLAMVGDPYWDVAQYAFQSAESKETFYKSYEVENTEKADSYIWLFALDFAAHLMKHYGTGNHQELEKCLDVLDEL
ncbi:MAG TPA: phosphotransferase [Bacillales bacterium]|nr:phosphotransferase [Bacillales bacterium]